MIYKLKYTTIDECFMDLEAKGILVNGHKTVESIVFIGTIIDKPKIVENGVVVSEATYLDGYHVDIMTDKEFNFPNQIHPKNPKHTFYGH